MRSRSRLTATVSSVIACVVFAACSGSRPTAPAPTVVALVVTGPPSSMQAGQTFQFTATLTFSDGRTTTSGFTWTSSDETIATVSATGLVTANTDGSVRIGASASGLTAWASLRVFPRTPASAALTGIVALSAGPSVIGVVADARVTVIDGPSAGTSATTNTYGEFALFGVDGVVTLRISAPGFDTLQVSAETGGRRVTIPLTRADHPVTDSAEWSLSPADQRQIYQGTLTFDMRAGGRVDLSTSAGLGASDSAPLCSELRDDDNRLIWTMQTVWQNPAYATLTLEGRRQYTLKINNCATESGRPTMNWYRLVAVHPS